MHCTQQNSLFYLVHSAIFSTLLFLAHPLAHSFGFGLRWPQRPKQRRKIPYVSVPLKGLYSHAAWAVLTVYEPSGSQTRAIADLLSTRLATARSAELQRPLVLSTLSSTLSSSSNNLEPNRRKINFCFDTTLWVQEIVEGFETEPSRSTVIPEEPILVGLVLTGSDTLNRLGFSKSIKLLSALDYQNSYWAKNKNLFWTTLLVLFVTKC